MQEVLGDSWEGVTIHRLKTAELECWLPENKDFYLDFHHARLKSLILAAKSHALAAPSLDSWPAQNWRSIILLKLNVNLSVCLPTIPLSLSVGNDKMTPPGYCKRLCSLQAAVLMFVPVTARNWHGGMYRLQLKGTDTLGAGSCLCLANRLCLPNWCRKLTTLAGEGSVPRSKPNAGKHQPGRQALAAPLHSLREQRFQRWAWGLCLGALWPAVQAHCFVFLQHLYSSLTLFFKVKSQCGNKESSELVILRPFIKVSAVRTSLGSNLTRCIKKSQFSLDPWAWKSVCLLNQLIITYSKKITPVVHEDQCTKMFITVLFILVKN